MRGTLPSEWWDLGMLLLVELLLVDLLLVVRRVGVLWRIVGNIVKSVVFALVEAGKSGRRHSRRVAAQGELAAGTTTG